MNSKMKFAALAMMQAVAAAALVACGGGSNGTDSADASSASTDAVSTAAITNDAVQATALEARDMSTQAALARYAVTVKPTAGGKVTGTSTLYNFNCSSATTAGCTSAVTKYNAVWLTATPETGYKFTGWGGACTGTARCTTVVMAPTSLTATFASTGTTTGSGGGTTSPVAVSGAPVVNYTDAVSGPVTGGENNLGGYLSIFGTNFGSASALGTTTRVYIGGVEVANYRFLGAAKVGAKLGMQQITVQVGNLNLPLGTAEPVKVVVNGTSSNVNNTFTPNPGRVLFVSLSGNDSTAVANDIAHPWRHLQTASNTGGIATVLAAGDQVVIRGGNWNDTSADGSWMRFRYTNQEGKAPTGAKGTGWIHFTAYPGPIKGNAVEDVHYSTPANTKGGFQGANSAYFGTTGDYISISNLRMDVSSAAENDAAPINVQYSAGPWRVVNNELGPWPSTIEALAAGVSGHGNGTAVLGNNIHDISSASGFENHGIYADSGASNWSIGFNWVHNITGGNLIQFFDNVGLAGQTYNGFPTGWTGFTGMKIFNNWLDTSGKYGINLADGTVSGAIWNNVIKGAKFSGIRINTISKNMDMTVAFNTFYDNDRVASGSGNGQVLNTWGNYNPTGTIRIYDNIFAAGPSTLRSSAFYVNSGATDAYLDFKRNLYYDNGYGWGANTRDPLAMLGDPKFAAASTGNLALASGSPAMNNATQSTPMAVTTDITGHDSRPQGGTDDLGAYEHVN
jgi:hypothetical protein